MEHERVAILVDGSNFYHYIKELGLTNQLSFDYQAFARSLSRDRQLVSATYYVGKVREDGSARSRRLMANQQRLTARLTQAGWQLGYGHLLKTDRYHEKGVDVLMAVDLLRGAYKNDYDTALLVSSDTDLIPAILEIRQAGKQLEYVGFSHRPSYGMIKNSDIRDLLKKEDLAGFLTAEPSRN